MNNELDIGIRRAVCNSPHTSYPHAQRLTELMLAEEKLARLEAGGVDNWEWYHASLHPTDKPSLDDFEQSVTNDPASDVGRVVYYIRVNDAVRREAFFDKDASIDFVIKTVLPALYEQFKSRTERQFVSIGDFVNPYWSNDMCSVKIDTLELK